VTIKAECVPYL